VEPIDHQRYIHIYNGTFTSREGKDMNAFSQLHMRSYLEVEELAGNLGSLFAERAGEFDRAGSFVHANYQDLREARFFSLIIPAQLGGGGLSFMQLASIGRIFAQHCGSTALAYVMHSHPVALNVFKHLRGDARASKTLTMLASEELAIAGTGANDWLLSNGTAEVVDGGYIVNAHKRFVSGAPGAQLLVTSVNCVQGDKTEVLHFALPITTQGIRQQTNWDTLGMRATGSNDVILDNVFVPEQSIVARRPAGEWHAMWDVILPIAMPLIMSTYLGLADTARRYAMGAVKRDASMAHLLGELNNQHVAAELAVADMIARNDNFGFTPSLANTEATLTRKTLAAIAIRNVVDMACVIVGGAGFFKCHPLERIARDVRAAHFHPLPLHKQIPFCGRIVAGLNPLDA